MIIRSAVYDGWLETLGGAERQMLGAVEAMRRLGPVTMISHRSLSRERLAEWSGRDLAGVEHDVRPDTPGLEGLLEGVESDVFVNATHNSWFPAPHAAGIMFVYFAASAGSRWKGAIGRLVGWAESRLGAAREGSGWYGPEARGWGWCRQSAGHGEIKASEGAELRLWLSDMDPAKDRPARSYRVVSSHGDTLCEARAGRHGRFEASPWVRVPTGASGVVVESEAREIEGSPDRRLIGLSLGAIDERSAPRRIWHLVTRRLVPAPARLGVEQRLADYGRAFRSYRVVSPNSHFTNYWLRRRWGIEGEVIYPPVTGEDAPLAPRDPLILSIGRFFTGSHNKKHDVMVEAFGRLVESGLRGWRLVLVGGVGERPEDRAYLERVRRAADELPVEVIADADEATLRDLRRRASICWHATGYGESERRHPERFEHFGIAVAELMASGVVPVVIDAGGLREIVRPGVDGFRWRTLDELAGCTLQLIRDARLRQRMAATARERAKRWSLEEYQTRIVELVRRVHAEAQTEQAMGVA